MYFRISFTRDIYCIDRSVCVFTRQNTNLARDLFYHRRIYILVELVIFIVYRWRYLYYLFVCALENLRGLRNGVNHALEHAPISHIDALPNIIATSNGGRDPSVVVERENSRHALNDLHPQYTTQHNMLRVKIYTAPRNSSSISLYTILINMIVQIRNSRVFMRC